MKLMLLAEKSSAVRKDWSRFVDEVIHKAPKFVQRNERDVFVSMNMHYMSLLMDNIRYSVNIDYDAESNEYVGTMNDFWFVEAGETEDEVKQKLAEQLLDSAIDYFKDLNLYHTTPDFKKQFPKVLKALVIDDVNGVIESFDVKHVRT